MNKLLVFQLTVQSSYADNVEREAQGKHFDTVQWWLASAEAWRIKTFVIDQDIHTHHIAHSVDVETAVENTMKHYGDVVAKAFVIEFDDLNDSDKVAAAMAELGGTPALEITGNGNSFAFWNPAQLHFTSGSAPE